MSALESDIREYLRGVPQPVGALAIAVNIGASPSSVRQALDTMEARGSVRREVLYQIDDRFELLPSVREEMEDTIGRALMGEVSDALLPAVVDAILARFDVSFKE